MYTLLVVDDNNRERLGISQLSMWHGYGFDRVLTAKNGMAGYETAIAEKPFLVVADVSMPIMDGLTMAKKIHEVYPETKFIFISCFDDSQYIREAFDVDAFGYILKPINMDKLRAVVEKIVNIDIEKKENDSIRKRLEKQIEENMQVVTEQISRDLLRGGLTCYDSLKRYGLEIKGFAAAALVRVDSPNKTEGSGYMYTYGIKRVFDENGFEDMRSVAFIHSRKSVGVLTFTDGAANEQEALESTINCYNIVKERINRDFEIEVSFFVGGAAKTYDALPKLFCNAEYIMDNSITDKNNGIILAENYKLDKGDLRYSSDVLKKELSRIIESNNIGEVSAFVDKYYPESEQHTRKNIRNFTVCVMTTLNLILFERDESFDNIFDGGFAVWEKLNDFNSILDIRQWVENMLRFTAEYINDKKTDRYTAMVADIKKIINSQYRTIENIDQVTAQIFMSTVHANSVFKKETGQTIFDYLTKVRMEKAKIMLADKNSKVYKVSENVGYKSKTYFTSLFREYTGMTPGEYRDKC